MRNLVLCALLLLGRDSLCGDRLGILLPREASSNGLLAAKEIRRYFYVRTGTFAEIIRTDDFVPERRDIVVLARVNSSLLKHIPLQRTFRDSLASLTKECYCLRTIRRGPNSLLLICGFDETATLYGAYSLVERLGVRFYAHGDVIPDGRIRAQIPDLDEWHFPHFSVRGLQPFHDFPEGPDWWDLDDYKALFSQMAKMRMNFLGLHTYPQGGVGPEPTVWIGFKEDVGSGHRVLSSYPARYFTTIGDPPWGYNPRKTGEYFWGLGQLFESDAFGSELMKGYTPHAPIGTGQPIPPGELWSVAPRAISDSGWNDLFERTGAFYASAFAFARDLGIKTCVGTETPLVIPESVKKRIAALGKDTTDDRIRQELYEGMFARIKQSYPVDYYWFWTPEDWTWSGNNEVQVELTRRDLEAARRAAENVHSPFVLATCGWVLGPKLDRSLFDTFLPKSWALSCINREVGYEPVDPGFAKVKDRPTWAIPWLEDDPGLIVPQLWVGRTRRDAADALAFGCTGLIGIHWRTKVLSPNISALANAGWKQEGWNSRSGERLTPDQAIARSREMQRDLPAGDFYRDWARAHFGEGVSEPIAAIFSSLDGMTKYDKGRASAVRLPLPADWVSGPGGIKADTLTWRERKRDYLFVDRLEAIRHAITGPENLERFDYWLNTFKYLRATGKFACSAGEISRLLERVKKDTVSPRTTYREAFVTLRTRQMDELREVLTYLLSTVSTRGELGTIANWQQHIMTFFVFVPGHEIERLLNSRLPDRCWPSSDVLKREKIIIPTVRASLRKGEDLRIKALLPGGDTQAPRLFWKPLSAKRFTSIELTHVNRDVWEGTIRAQDLVGDFEYYIELRTPNATLRYPVGAPGRSQTVVVY